MKYIDGSVYEGHWLNNVNNGFGTFTSKDGKEVHLGEWCENKKEGQGVVAYANGDIFIATFDSNSTTRYGIIIIQYYLCCIEVIIAL